jgi:putative tryptophan/tyrosine transport system substrate-binding protein
MTTRRALIGTLAGGFFAAPFAAWAQPAPKIYRIGLLGGNPPNHPSGRVWEAFFQGLRELGYVESQNILVEGRWYGEQPERLPALAAELVRAKVDVIVAGTAPSPEAARRATSTIPIVMANHPDPVGSGLVVSLAKPGRNVTGLSSLSPELVGKQLQLLKEIVPGLSRVAVLWNPTVPSQKLSLREAEDAARSSKVQLQVVEAQAPRDLAGAFQSMTKERSGGLIAFGGSVFFAERSQIVALAAQSRLPAIYAVREFAEAGGLMAYGNNIHESWRRAATYVDKILKGAKPADLPVEQPTKFELVINMRTAKALGLTIPPAVLARADEVIE